MKNFKILTIGLFIIGCLSEPTFALKKSNNFNLVKTIVTGKISVYSNSSKLSSVTLFKWNSAELVNGFQQLNSEIDDKGNFKFEFTISQTETVSILFNNDAVFKNVYSQMGMLITPGDSLHIEIPELTKIGLNEITFSGVGFEKQLLLRDISRNINNSFSLNDVDGKVFRKEISLSHYYEASVDEAIREKLILDSILLLNPYRMDTTEMNYTKVFVLAKIYYNALDIFDSADLSSTEIVASYKKLRENIHLDNLLIQHNLYSASDITYDRIFIKRALLDYLLTNHLPSYSIFTEKGRNLSLEYKIINEAFKNEKFRSRLLAGFIILYGQRDWNEKIDLLARAFYESFPDIDPFHNQVRFIEKQIKISNDKSRLTYKFSLTDTSGVVRSSDEFKGKAILLDFMFNGCGNCAEMVPFLEKIEEQFKNKNIVFLSVSIDPTMKIFKNGVAKFMTKGSIPLFTNGEGASHDVLKFYNVTGAPTLVLIDKNGHIVSTKAPDPRTEKGTKDLTDMIIKALL